MFLKQDEFGIRLKVKKNNVCQMSANFSIFMEFFEIF